jgi:hypothetical protein
MKGEIPVDPGSFIFILTKKGTFSIYPGYEKDLTHVNTFSCNTKLDLNASIEQFVKDDTTYASWFTNAKKVEVVNCVVNLLSPIKEPFRDNTLLIGDAAWIMEFSNMAALCSGWKAGHAIALAIIDKNIGKEGIKSYLEWWEECFYGPYGRYDFGMGAGEPQDYLKAEEIDYLASLVKEPFPATMNFFTLFTTIGKTYAELFTTVEGERLEVMGKLIEMRSKMEEVRKNTIKMGFPNR